MFRFRRAAFCQGLQEQIGLAAAKPAALRINLNLDGCSVVAPLMHAPSRAPLLLVLGGQPNPHKPRLVVFHSTHYPHAPHAHSFVIGPVVVNNNQPANPPVWSPGWVWRRQGSGQTRAHRGPVEPVSIT